MLSDDMRDNVILYYLWARVQDPSDVGFRHCDPVAKLRGGGIGCEGLSDDEAEWINRALCALGRDNPDDLALIEQVHKRGKSLRWLESKGWGNRKELSYRVSGALDFIRGYLSANQAA